MENSRLNQLFSFLERSPLDSFTLYSIGLEYLQMEDYKNAQNYFQKVYNHDPSYLGTYYQLAKCLRLLDNDEEAMEIYRQGMEQAKTQKKQHTFAELQNALMNTELGEDP